MRNLHLTVMYIALVLSLAASIETETRTPGKGAIWTFGGETNKAMSYNTQTVDVPEFIRLLEEGSKQSEILVHVKPEKGSSFSVPTIKESIKGAKTSMVLPTVFLPPSESRGQMSGFDHIKNSKLFQNSNEISLADLQRVANKDALKNDQLDTFVVSLGAQDDHDALFKIASIATETRRVTFVVLDEPTAQIPVRQAQYSRILSTASSDLADGIYYKPEGAEYAIYYADTYLYITPDIFTGALTGLFFVFVFLVGYSCLGAIQGPSTFANKSPPVGKEA